MNFQQTMDEVQHKESTDIIPPERRQRVLWVHTAMQASD